MPQVSQSASEFGRMTSQSTGRPFNARQVAFCAADSRANITQTRMPNNQRRCARRESMGEPIAARLVCHKAGVSRRWPVAIRPAAGAGRLAFDMPRYAAFLRGVMPMNCKMPALREAFEAAGFTDVKTVLGSGNVVFDARSTSEDALQQKAEEAMQDRLGRAFPTIVRPVEQLRKILASDPYRAFKVNPKAKRIVAFLRGRPTAKIKLPVELGGARILAMKDGEIFSAYLPNPKGPVFMSLIEKTFGKDLTTRTWDTVAKVAR